MRCSPLLLAVAAHALAPLPRAKHLGRRGAVVSEPEVKSNARSYADLTIGVVAESDPSENRVAQTPESLALLVKAGFNAKVASGAGAAAGFSDDMYKSIGAQITTEEEAWASDIVTKIAPPSSAEAAKVGDRMLLSMVQPPQNDALMQQLQEQGSTVFAMDCIPRLLSRGQAFDALSSQANLAGFRAVIEAAHAYGRTMAGSMTAAGKSPRLKCCGAFDATRLHLTSMRVVSFPILRYTQASSRRPASWCSARAWRASRPSKPPKTWARLC